MLSSQHDTLQFIHHKEAWLLISGEGQLYDRPTLCICEPLTG